MVNIQKKVISIDHGNALMKTVNHVFTASFVAGGHVSAIISNDTIKYEGMEYELSDNRMPVKKNKTIDNQYFILTLFALGKELELEHLDGNHYEITLLVGLPILYYKDQKEKFKQYFLNHGVIEYVFNGKKLSIEITVCEVFPQGYAATTMLPKQGQNKISTTVIDTGGHTTDVIQINADGKPNKDNCTSHDYKISTTVIDIGGYTTDVIQINADGKPNKDNCTSHDYGVNKLFSNINKKVRADGGQNVSDDTLRSIIMDLDLNVPQSIHTAKAIVEQQTNLYVSNLLTEIANDGIDFDNERCLFIGGGSDLFINKIKKDGRVKMLFHTSNLCINAIGYQKIYDAKQEELRRTALVAMQKELTTKGVVVTSA